MTPENLAVDLTDHLDDNIDGDPFVVATELIGSSVLVKFSDSDERLRIDVSWDT